MDVLLHIAIGIGLSAAAGFRILVPFLIAGVAAQQGYLTLSPSMAWMSTTPAIIALAAATALEVLIYFVPVVDNLMDAVELPAAAIAGTVLTAAVTGGDMNPFLQWSLGGVASSTQAFTGLTRLASTAAAGPVGNIAVSTTELASSTILSVLAIAVPILVLILVGILLYLVFRRRSRQRRRVY